MLKKTKGKDGWTALKPNQREREVNNEELVEEITYQISQQQGAFEDVING